MAEIKGKIKARLNHMIAVMCGDRITFANSTKGGYRCCTCSGVFDRLGGLHTLVRGR